MVALGSFAISVYKAQKGLDFGVTPIPGSNGTSAFLGGDVIGIAKGAKNAQTAWDFIAWSMGDEVQKTVVVPTGQLAVRSDISGAQPDPRLVQANKLIADAKVPVTAKYNSLFIDPTGPYLRFIREWVFTGDPAKAIDQGKSGFSSRLAS
jgi:multiple sugar transport system substrate-binding protein